MYTYMPLYSSLPLPSFPPLSPPVAVLTVTRAIGQIGDVTLPYTLDSSAMNDISPTSDVIVFANGEMEKVGIN